MAKKSHFLHPISEIPFPIDIVYLWIDGADPKFRQTKAKYLREAGKDDSKYLPDAVKDQIYRDNDELKYSLRSVEKYAPWINHIYIVTALGQVPKWLDTTNPRITVVPQESILPPDASPIFNSCAIEASLPNIPGLSEHFLLANDDMFFNSPIKPDYFFTKNGIAKYRYIYRKNGRNAGDKNVVYSFHLINAAHAIEQAFNADFYNYKSSHGIDPYIKSSMIDVCNHPIIGPIIYATKHRRFRDKNDIHRSVFNLYDCVTGRAKMLRIHSRHNGHNILLDFIYNLIHYNSVRNSVFFCKDAIESHVLSCNTKMVCINDGTDTSDSNLENNKQFFNTKFPHKSGFET